MGVNVPEVNTEVNSQVEVAATPTETTTQETKPTEQPAQESRLEKAFAEKWKKEREKWETEYSPYKNVLSKAAAENGMTLDEYVQELSKTYEQKEFEGLNPNLVEDIKWAREQRTKANQPEQTEDETARFNTEVKSLVERFPDLKTADDIPDEVLEARIKDNVPLRYAYADYLLGKERQRIEQETLQKIRENDMSSPGSLSSGTVDTSLKVSELSTDDFKKLQDEVMRGKRRSLK